MSETEKVKEVAAVEKLEEAEAVALKDDLKKVASPGEIVGAPSKGYDYKSDSEKTFEDQLADKDKAENLKDKETKDKEEKARVEAFEGYETKSEEGFHRFFINHCKNGQLDDDLPKEIKGRHKAAQYLAENDTKFIALIEALQLYLDTYYSKAQITDIEQVALNSWRPDKPDEDDKEEDLEKPE